MSIKVSNEQSNKATTNMVSPNFITEIIQEDLKADRYSQIVTRFPPEPNGYAHVGHTIASFINFGLAHDFNGRCNLRMDDTNPETERQEYADAIRDDLRWLGWDWEDRFYYASDYFEQLYDFAVKLIKAGKAYVDSSSEDDIQRMRGTVTEPGVESPYRNRTIEENLDLFERMRAGEFPEGTHVLRGKIDMSSPNMKMRDPLFYRILHKTHYRTGDTWCIYPFYDFAHPLSDAIEGVTHSLCSLEFVDNRAVYDWLMENLIDGQRPHQYEFGRRSLEFTVVSKRKLIKLIESGHVSGWDDPRMPTLAGLRRRGVTPEAIRDFASRVGISRTNRTVDIALLEYSIRDDLNYRAPRVLAVLNPLKVIITNYPDDKEEQLESPYWPKDVPNEGSRLLPFAKELYIERDDFQEHPEKGFKRLSPGEEVRLRYAYVIRCDEVIKDADGNITELRCHYDPDTLNKNPAGRKVKAAIHWLAAKQAIPAEFRLYERLFTVANPDAGDGDFLDYVNPESLLVRHGFVEPGILKDDAEQRYQFERQGYFVQDSKDSTPDSLVFNRIVTLKDSWAKTQQAPAKQPAEPDPVHKTASEPGEARDPRLDFSAAQHDTLNTYLNTYQLSEDDAVLIAADTQLSAFFEEALSVHNNPQQLANWIVNEVMREMKGATLNELPFSAKDIATLVKLIDDGVINNRIAKDVFADMLSSGQRPDEIVKDKNLTQITDTAEIEAVVRNVLADNADKVETYKQGKHGLIGFFVGQVMRATQGKANPQVVKSLIEQQLAD